MLEMATVFNSISNFLHVVWEFLLTYFIGTIYLPKQLITKHRIPSDLKTRKGQVAIVTGGTRGLGLEVVKQLLGLRMHVIVACRNPADNEQLLEKLSTDYSEAKVEAMKLDLCSLSSIREFAKRFLDTNLPLHLLINNAGIMFSPYSLTCEGFESQLGTNYLGHFLLTHLLLPKLKETGTADQHARIVNVSSCVAFVGDINFDDLQSKNCYSSHGCYAQSKLAQILFTWSLQEQLSSESASVAVSALHPGMINTDLYEHVWWARAAPFVAKAVLKTSAQGADTIIYAACSSGIESIGGRYYENCEEVKPPKAVLNQELRRRLWDESCTLVGIKA